MNRYKYITPVYSGSSYMMWLMQTMQTTIKPMWHPLTINSHANLALYLPLVGVSSAGTDYESDH